MPERAGRVVARGRLDRHARRAGLDRHADGLAVEQRHADEQVGARARPARTRARRSRAPARRRRRSRVGAPARARPLAGSTRPALVEVVRAGSPAGRPRAARRVASASSSERRPRPARRRGSPSPAGGRAAAMPASTRPHSPSTSIASNASSPAPPWSSSISRPGQPASHGGRPQVGQRVLVAVERLAGGLERLEARQRAARGLAQEHLLV